MARTAFCGEVCLSCGGVTDKNVQCKRWTGRRTALTLRRRRNAVNVFSDSLDVVQRYRNRRHRGQSRIVQAVTNDRKDQFAVLIVEHELRPQKVDSALFSTPKVRAVTGPAMDAVQRISASNNRRITGRTLLGWKVSRAAAPRPAPPRLP